MSDELPPKTGGNDNVRGGNGQFVRTPDQATRDAKAAELRGAGWTYPAIAAELGITKGRAFAAVKRAIMEIIKEPAEQARAVELARLEDAHDHALGVLLREHVTVSHGRIVTDDEGNAIIDDGPVLAAIDRIRSLSESRRKLLGLDSPAQVEHTGGIKYEVVGIAPEDLV